MSSDASVLFKGFYHLLLSQVVTRVITFALNLLAARLLSVDTYGVAAVQFHLINTTILFLSREGFRRGCLRVRQGAGDAPRTVALRVLRTAWLVLPVGALITAAVTGFAVRQAARAGAGWGDVHLQALLLQGLAAFVELCSEPLYILAQTQLLFRLRVGAEAAATLARGVLTLSLLSGGSIAPELALSLAQLAYAGVTLAVYAARYACCGLGQHGSAPAEREPLLDWPTLRVVGSFSVQTGEKLLLAEGSKFVLTAYQTPYQQGVYGFVANLGSLVVRTLFQPLEEAAFLAFSLHAKGRSAASSGHGKPHDAAAGEGEPAPRSEAPGGAQGPDGQTQPGAASSSPSKPSSTAEPAASQAGERVGVPRRRPGAAAERDAAEKIEKGRNGGEGSGQGPAGEEKERDGDERGAWLLSVAVRSVSIVGLTAVAFGPAFAYTALRLVYGRRWADTGAPPVLAAYSAYVLLLALNGVLEAFTHARMSGPEMGRANAWLVAFSGVHLGLSIAAVRTSGALGLVAADGLNMALRIGYCLAYVRGTFARQPGGFRLASLCPRPAVLLCAGLVCCLCCLSEAALVPEGCSGRALGLLLGAGRTQRALGLEGLIRAVQAAPFLERAAGHVGVGAACLALLGGAVLRAERGLLGDVRALRRGL